MLQVAFLRAINVGGHVVKMDVLKKIFESEGLTNVATYIASGNVTFESDERAATLEKRLETTLRRELGYDVVTFVRSIDEVQKVAACSSFSSEGKLYVGFLKTKPAAAATKAVLALRTETDDLQFHGRELYWLLQGNFSDSKLSGGVLEKALGAPMTVRGIGTVQKIAAKWG